jgi:hypothetical protein
MHPFKSYVVQVKEFYYLKRKKFLFRYFPTPDEVMFNKFNIFLNKSGFNLCFNKRIPNAYRKDMKNILIVTESPEVVTSRQWIKDNMNFIAEISFANFFKLDNYYCCREIYSTMDVFVKLSETKEITIVDKTDSISFILSNNKSLSGHKFRFLILESKLNGIDYFGFGAEKPLKNKLDSLRTYRFQIVVENCKHPEYVSEKFFDCIKTLTIPIYWGGEKGINEMGFNTKGILFFNNLEELQNIINKINMSSIIYSELYPYTLENKEKLINIRYKNKLNFILNSVSYKYFNINNNYHNENIHPDICFFD